MNSAARSPTIASSTRYTAHTQYGLRWPAVASTSRPTSWITATPRLPTPALIASARP